MKTWKKALITFMIYYVVIYVGAAIMMYIERDELKSKSTVDASKVERQRLKDMLLFEHNVTLNHSQLSKVIYTSIYANRCDKKLSWLKDIFHTRHNMMVKNLSQLPEIISLSYDIAVKDAANFKAWRKQWWKRKNSFNTLITWRYFTQVTITTVGRYL